MLIAPWRAWPQIAKEQERHWLARPLFALFVYGCAASLIISGRVTARLILPSMLHAVYAPALQMAALGVVCRGALPFRRAVDLFFAGHAAISVTLLAIAAGWGFLPAATMYAHAGIWLSAGLAAIVWSGHVDYWFFRVVVGRRPAAAVAALVLHRLLWGIPALAIFVGPAAWQELLTAAGL